MIHSNLKVAVFTTALCAVWCGANLARVEAARAKKDRVVILPLDANSAETKRIAAKATNEIRRQLARNPRVSLRLLRKHGHRSGLAACVQKPDCVVTIVDKKAHFLLAGWVEEQGGQILVTLLVLSPKTGALLASDIYSGSSAEQAPRSSASLARRLIQRARTGKGQPIVAASATNNNEQEPSSTDDREVPEDPETIAANAAKAAAPTKTADPLDGENPFAQKNAPSKTASSKSAALVDETPKPPSFWSHIFSTHQWKGWTFASLGVASLGVGLLTGIKTFSANVAAKDAPLQVESADHWQDAKTFSVVTNVLLAVGGGAVVTSLLFFYFEYDDDLESPPSPTRSKTAAWRAAPLLVEGQGGGLILQRHF